MYLQAQKPLQSFDLSPKAVICRGGRVLLLRRPNGRWDLPGGKARKGEHVTDALRREVREETGLTIGTFEQVSVAQRRRSNGHNCLVVSYRCTVMWPPEGALIALSGEHDAYEFFAFGQTADLRLRAHHKEAICAARHQAYLVRAA